MYSKVKDVKIGDTVFVDRFNHKGTVIDIKEGKVYSINDKNVVCVFTDRDRFKIIDTINFIAKVILDIVFFFTKRPKLK
jgi:hypothetical protein